MKLITETTDNIKFVKEDVASGPSNYFIEGIFMQAETKNRNGRVYPSKILFNEVTNYNTNYINENRALGELGHPETPSVNLDRVSHLIKELRVSGNNVVGRAKLMETPMGKIAKNLLDEGAKLGVSSRGMGSLDERGGVSFVGEDFMLSAIDIVADPSAPDAFVNGIMEGKEWVWDNGLIKEKTINHYRKVIASAPSKKTLDEVSLWCFADFLSKL